MRNFIKLKKKWNLFINVKSCFYLKEWFFIFKVRVNSLYNIQILRYVLVNKKVEFKKIV